MKCIRRVFLAVAVIAFLFYASAAFAEQNKRIQTIIQCIQLLRCSKPLQVLTLSDNSFALSLLITLNAAKEERILLIKGGIAVRLLDRIAHSITVIFDKEADGVIDDITTGDERDDKQVNREVSELSDKEKEEYQHRFDSILDQVRILKEPSSRKERVV